MAKWHKNRKEIRNSVYKHDYQEYIDSKKTIIYVGCHPTSLSVIINRCQNLIISKHHMANKPLRKTWLKVKVVVYMKLITYDLYLSTLEGEMFNYREYFTIEIDENVPDDMIIVSTLDQKFIESIQIINGNING